MIVRILVIVFTVIGSWLNAQTEQNLIDRQVWIPFTESYSNFDAEKFIDVHAENMIRVNRDGEEIKTIAEYAENVRNRWPAQIEKGRKRKLELRFSQRIATETDAFEVGIYKVSYPNEDGSETNHYGRFHVVLKKTDGIWKITVDADSNYGKTISEKDFLNAVPIE